MRTHQHLRSESKPYEHGDNSTLKNTDSLPLFWNGLLYGTEFPILTPHLQGHLAAETDIRISGIDLRD